MGVDGYAFIYYKTRQKSTHSTLRSVPRLRSEWLKGWGVLW